MPADDPFMELRVRELRKRALLFRPILSAARAFAPNPASREKASRIADSFRRTFGEPSWKDRLLSAAFLCSACIESARIHARSALGLGELVRQPPVRRVCNAAALADSLPAHRGRSIVLPETMTNKPSPADVGLPRFADHAGRHA